MLDLIILAVLALGLLRGLFTGVIRQVASIVGLILSFALALQLMYPVGEVVADAFDTSERIGSLGGFIIVFIAVQVGVLLITRVLEKVLQFFRLSALNRIAGGLLGGLKAALLLSLIFLLTGMVGVPGHETRQSSALYRPVASVLPRTWNVIVGRLPEANSLGRRFGATPPASAPTD